jgi:hypothetical protein
MPAGNHHYTPHGFWHQTPPGATVPRLVLKTCRDLAFLGLFIVGVNAYRSLQWKYTYTSFIGKTITMEKVSQLTHEPASVEVIDSLKNSAK